MSKALVCAVRLLARREHSLAELTEKLTQKGHADVDIQDALERCQRQGLQCDVRFAESLTRTRIRQGYGPARIRQELRAKQVLRETIDAVLDEERDNWISYARGVWEKKYKSVDKVSFAEQQKQKQFLLVRGFMMDTIAKVVQ